MLKRQVESPLEFYAREHDEREQRDRRITHILDLAGASVEPQHTGPSYKDAGPLLFMDDELKAGYPFTGRGVAGTMTGLRPGDQARYADASATLLIDLGRPVRKPRKGRAGTADQGSGRR